MGKISLNEWSVSGEIIYLKEVDGDFAASVTIRGTATREGSFSTQILELNCLLQKKVYEEAKKKGFEKYKEVTLSGHLESWVMKNDTKGKTRVRFIVDYVMDIQ